MNDKTKGILSNIMYIAFVLLFSFLIVRFIGQRTEVIGSSMVPTLEDGNQLITDKISYRFHEPERFDIIVFPHEPMDEYYIKRIIGLPGETVEIADDGTIYPRQYIEMLETTGMIGELDLYILEECCRTLSAWRGTEKQNLWLSCNMTRITLSDDAFLERFCKVTEAYDFDHGKLVLEITEDALADNSEQIVRNIERCKQMGYRIALDDFGNGYSSVRDLDDYPIDIIKIDRDIILGSRSDRGKRLLIGIVGLAHFLGIEALCEGVEIEQERAAAREAECDYIQGYLLAHPAPADEKSTDRGVVFA